MNIKSQVKKILILLIVILSLLSTIAITKSFAIVTDEMDATGKGIENRKYKGSDGYYFTSKDLDGRYDVFCCQHNTAAYGQEPGDTAGFIINGSTYEVLNDAKYSDGVWTMAPKAGYQAGSTYYTKIPMYKSKGGPKTATPKEAYILAEMEASEYENDNSNRSKKYITINPLVFLSGGKTEISNPVELGEYLIDVEGLETPFEVKVFETVESGYKRYYAYVDGKYFKGDLKIDNSDNAVYGKRTYIQEAWWTTVAGSEGDAVPENQLAQISKAFEEYILRAAKVTKTSDLKYVDHTYSIISNGKEHTGTVKAPELKQPSWDESTDIKNAKVAWDGDTQTYKVGPFKLNYGYGEYEYSENGSPKNVFFGGITGCEVTTNLGVLDLYHGLEEEEYKAGSYKFIYKNGAESDTIYPKPGTEFYIEIPYMEGLESIENIQFNFKYMNAGGTYEKFAGKKYAQYWTAKASGLVATSSTYGTKIQTYAYASNAARWYEETSLSTSSFIVQKQGALAIEKRVVNESGEEVTVEENTDFEFDVTVNGVTTPYIVTVPAGASSAKKIVAEEVWGTIKNEDGTTKEIPVPTFTVVEKNKEGYQLVKYESDKAGVVNSGDFSENTTITVSAINTQASKTGHIKIVKTIEDKTGTLLDRTFYFKVYINGEEKETLEIKGQGEATSSEYEWYGEAPTYKVVEVDKDGNEIDEDDDFVASLTNETGKLGENDPVVVNALNTIKTYEGILNITKILKTKSGTEVTDADPFIFDVEVEGYEPMPVEVKPGEENSWSETFAWAGNQAPKYKITERKSDRAKFESITNGTETVTDGELRCIEGTLDKDQNVYITAENTADERAGKLVIEKHVVTAKTNADGTVEYVETPLKEDKTFTFKVEIILETGKTLIIHSDVLVKEGESFGTSSDIECGWSGDQVVKYKITEETEEHFNIIDELSTMEGIVPEYNEEDETTIAKAVAINEKELEDKTGKLVVEKQIVDKDGNITEAKEPATVIFDIKVTNANGEVINDSAVLNILKGDTVKTSEVFEYTWKENEEAPTYEVTESCTNENYKFVEISENAKGTLNPDSTDPIKVIAKNKEEGLKTGKLVVEKQIVDKDGNIVEAKEPATVIFDIEVTKANGEVIKDSAVLEFAKGDTAKTSEVFEYTWKESEGTPTYEVTETCTNENYKLVEISENAVGTLNPDSEDPIKVIAQNKEEGLKTGKLIVEKQIVDDEGKIVKAKKDTSFTFDIVVTKADKTTINDTVTLNFAKGDKTKTSEVFEYTWNDDEETPTYVVTERMNNENYEFVSISSNSEGTLNPDSEDPIKVIAQNKLREEESKEGKLRLIKRLDKPASEEVTFKFFVKVWSDGCKDVREEELTVKKGETSAEKVIEGYKWDENMDVPNYIVVETEIPSGYKFVDKIYDLGGENETKYTQNEQEIPYTFKGTLKENDTITVAFDNTEGGVVDHQGSIRILKQVKDKNGNLVPADRDYEFKFKATIDGKEQELTVKIPVGQSEGYSETITRMWNDGEKVPTYIIEEIPVPGFTPQNKVMAGNFEDKKGEPIVVNYINIKDEIIHHGSIKILKQVKDENGNLVPAKEDLEFKFNVAVTGEEIKQITIKIPVGASEGYSEVIEKDWKDGETAPTYTISEVSKEGYKPAQSAITGTFEDSTETLAVTYINIKEKIVKNGSIKILKQVKDKEGNLVKAKEDLQFKFNVEINGKSEEVIIKVAKGASEGYSKVITRQWNEDESAPEYKITEIPTEGYTPSLSEVTGNFEEKEEAVVVSYINIKDVVTKSGKLKITKQIVDSEGNETKVEKDTTFTFNIDIYYADGRTDSQQVNVVVKAGKGTAEYQELEYYWNEDETAPKYKVTEAKVDGYELAGEIENGEGELTENTIIRVNAKNKVEELSGKIKIVKEVTDTDELNNTEFTIKIYKNDLEYKTVTVTPDKPYEEEFKWNSNEKTPVISVEEINIPETSELVTYVNNGKNLIENGELVITAVNKAKVQEGKLEISKILYKDKKQNEEVDGIEFEFTLTINGESKDITVKSGETYRTDTYYWIGEAPKYTISEKAKNGYGQISIDSSEGSLEENKTISITAKNYMEEQKEGKIKITKKIEMDDKVDVSTIKDAFKFKVKVYYEDKTQYFEYNGAQYNELMITKQINGEGTSDSVEIKWRGNEAPKYYVEEIDIPNEFKLKEMSNSSGSLVENSEITVNCINEQTLERRYIFTMEMGGVVWNDTDATHGKPTDCHEDGRIGDQEERFAGILVEIYRVVKDRSGKLISNEKVLSEIVDEYNTVLTDGNLYTDADGIWKISKIAVPALTEAEKTAGGYTDEKGYGYVANYSVVFTYDGQTYEPTTFLVQSNGDAAAYKKASAAEKDKYLDNSMAIDGTKVREEFNKRFETIYGGTGINSEVNDGQTTVVGSSTAGENTLEYTVKDEGTKKISTLNTLNSDGTIKDLFKIKASTYEADLLYPFDNKTVLTSTDTTINFGKKVITYKYHAAYPYLNSINLGLIERLEADLATSKDLLNATVVVNGKALVYNYGEIVNQAWEAGNGTDLLYKQIALDENKLEYNLNLNTADYYFRAGSLYTAENGASAELLNALSATYGNLNNLDLEVYLKYQITIYNEGAYKAKVNKLTDYYSNELELVEEDVNTYLTTMNSKEINGNYKVAEKSEGWANNKAASKATYVNDVILDSGASQSIQLTFKVAKGNDKNTLVSKTLTDCILLGDKYNSAEIDSYSTFNSDGTIAGRIDRDCAPGDINKSNPFKDSLFEDDTESAPALHIGLYKTSRKIDGLTWEDAQDKNIENSQVIGNGIYGTEDTTISNMTTNLYQTITLNGNTYEFKMPKTFNINATTTINDLIPKYNVDTKTDDNGMYNLAGFVAGNYFVRFTYGDENTTNYSGQNYKSTTYQTGFANINADKTLNVPAHDLLNEALSNTRVSDALDSEARRLELIEKSQTQTFKETSEMDKIDNPSTTVIEDITDLINNYSRMYADTAKLDLNIELNKLVGGEALIKEKGVDVKTSAEAAGKFDVTSVDYIVKNIDFGLEERSKNEIVLDKQIKEIKLTTSSGDVMLDAIWDITYDIITETKTDGSIKDGTSRYTVTKTLNAGSSIGTNNMQALDNNGRQQGYRYINIDEDVLQGTTISIKYQITALNIGEVDRCADDLIAITDFDVAIDDARTLNTAGNYGKYLGEVYYQGANNDEAFIWDDEVVRTEVKQVVDYVDNDVVFSQMENVVTDGSWTNTSTAELTSISNHLIDPSIVTDGKLVDNEGRAYEDGTNNLTISVENNAAGTSLNNPDLMKYTVPHTKAGSVIETDNTGKITLNTSRYYSSEDDTQNIDNATEVIKLYNDVGRRVYTILGNAKVASSEGIYEATYDEMDSSATEVITLSPPTGIEQSLMFTIQLMSVILSSMAILAGGIVIIKKKLLTK